METVFIDRRGTNLTANQGRLCIKHESGSINTSIPLQQMRALVISCDCALSVSMLRTLGEHHIALICLNPRNIDASLISVPERHGDISLRINQYALQRDAVISTRIARLLVHQKIVQQRHLLAECLHERADCWYPLTHSIRQLDGILQQLPHAAGPQQLMGYEGTAARIYFAAFQCVFPASWQFTQRNKRPPRDPVNALLSLAYTLLYFDALRACYAAGLDPQLGFLHQPGYGRAALACDLVELLRHRVDRWVWDLVRQQTLRLDHFDTADQGACLLNKTGRKHFYEQYMQQAPHWLQRMRKLSARLAHELERSSV